MLDDLRNSAVQQQEEEELPPVRPPKAPSRPQGPFLGMTAPQRFLLALMLFLMVLVLGTFFLVLTERLVFPFF
jgi:hypothetical protein